MQIIQLLVAAGASVNAIEEFKKRTPLRFTLQLLMPRPDLVDYLLVQGADVNVHNWLGRTPFFQLLIHFDATIDVERFQCLGGKMGVTDDDGNTPLHLVQSPEIPLLLLASGTSPASTNKYGETPLHKVSSMTPPHHASITWGIDIIARMLYCYVDIEAKYSRGTSPLLTASASEIAWDRLLHSTQQTINYLLEYRADTGAVNEGGESAARLIGVKGYLFNEAGKLRPIPGRHSEQVQDVGREICRERPKRLYIHLID